MGESGQWVRHPACQFHWIRSAVLVFQLGILGMDGKVSSLAATDCGSDASGGLIQDQPGC